MRTIIKNYFVLCFFFLVFALSISYAATLEETFKKSIPLRSGGKLEVENLNGNITIESWNKEEVYIEAEKQVRGGDRKDAERFMDELKVDIEEHGNEIIITTKHPRKQGGDFWDWVFGDNVSSSVSYNIRVPQKCDIEATSTNGGVYVTYVEGNIRLRTTNGKINAESVKGVVSARTTNGSVKIELDEVKLNEEMEFLTTNGSVTLYFPKDINCDIRAKTTNGSIRTDFPLEVRGKYGSKRLDGKINGGGPVIFIETTNGSIKLLET
jgi:DUF4097 and DUF4098 domain-containing protein YvlB